MKEIEQSPGTYYVTHIKDKVNNWNVQQSDSLWNALQWINSGGNYNSEAKVYRFSDFREPELIVKYVDLP